MKDMYTAGFYPFATQEEKWAYWALHISLNREEPVGAPENLTATIAFREDIDLVLQDLTNIRNYYE